MESEFNFKTYQAHSRQTAQYEAIGHGVIYPTLGLASEAGEVAGKIKKVFRDKGGVFNEEEREKIAAELGDVLWYVAQVATELGLDLEVIARQNLEKLLSRKARGQIKGDGDAR